MKIYNTLIINYGKKQVEILFGIPDTEEEKEKMFKLRFNVYSQKGYIDPSRYPDNLEKDNYDNDEIVTYFIAKIRNEVIGTARLIKTNPLPTQLYFKFEEPIIMQKIPPEKKAEIGRLIVTPYKLEDNQYLPRHIVLLFLFKSILDYSVENNYQAGYAFIKTKLFEKLKYLRIPFHLIEDYKQIYPEDGDLYYYFNDKNDKVVPIYYLADEVHNYFKKFINNKIFFKNLGDNKFMVRRFIYSAILKVLKIFKKR